MRLWSLHPQYLDAKGLVALWREALLAKKVLQAGTKGYTNHPQLIRFKNNSFPLKAINNYLFNIFLEAEKRGYSFKKSKINQPVKKIGKIKVTSGQINYEFNHLKKKLKKRNSSFFQKITKVEKIKPHPLFIIVQGKVETWEKQIL